MLDRAGLSEKNGWKAGNGTCIYFTQKEIRQLLRFGSDKACRLFLLLKEVGLIRRKKQGQGKENIDYEILAEREDRTRLNELVMLMVDVICGTGKTVRIGGSSYPREAVRSRLLKLGPEHIEYVIGRMKTTTADIRNIRSYMLTSLYYAPTTIDSYYDAKVRHDMPELAN